MLHACTISMDGDTVQIIPHYSGDVEGPRNFTFFEPPPVKITAFAVERPLFDSLLADFSAEFEVS